MAAEVGPSDVGPSVELVPALAQEVDFLWVFQVVQVFQVVGEEARPQDQMSPGNLLAWLVPPA